MKKQFQKYIKNFKKGTFSEAFNSVKKNPKQFFFSVLMDLCFLLAALLLGWIGNKITPFLIRSNDMTAMIISMFIYALLLVLIYSFTKYIALYFVKNIFKKVKFTLSKIENFYLVNIIGVVILLVAAALLSSIVLGGLRQSFIEWASKILITFAILFIVVLIGFAHSLFALGFNLKDVLKKAFSLTFSKLNKYYGIFVFNIGSFLVYSGIYYGLAKVLEVFFTLNISRFNTLFSALGVLLFHFFQAFNRVYFYIIAKRITK
ncbi:hypothetical protein ACFLZ6_02070 [Nanoarchaeota archaeon]